MTRWGDIEDIERSYGKCSVCGRKSELGNGVCVQCWDKGHGRQQTLQEKFGRPVYRKELEVLKRKGAQDE